MSGLLPHISAAGLFNVHRPHDFTKLKEQGRMMLISTNTATRCGYLTVLLILSMASAFTPSVAQDFPPDVTRGQRLYERHCLACHGAGGRGDGPDAAALRVPPTNFHRFSSVLKSDEELLRTIEHGIVFSSMHSWQGVLTETERQDALAYIRLLVQQGR
jgi:mono/diheme cytochrome c family protein